MSYDLYFYKNKNNKISEAEVIEEFKNTIPFKISEIDSQIVYENERTGVNFLIDFNEPNTDQEDIELFDNFDEFEYLNINASINFLRPDYFGLEIFPLINKVVDKLDLYILNLQEFDESKHKPIKWTGKELCEHWTLHNSIVSKQQFKELGLNFMAKEKSDKLWNYTRLIDKIEKEIKEDIYVPNAFVIQNKDTQDLFTFIVWSESIPLILPRVDFVIILKKYKKLFKQIEEIGMVKYQDILDKFASEFEVYDSKNELLLLRQNNADTIKKDFNKFPIWKSHKEFGPQVSLGGFVNNK
ncbi:hypothetical protein [Sunxiuqinia dokdonensis]|uniref:Uncharacterized protein n=1 Tax=Sunxiuqinia dokdonensis TaxID=1409788 RepID=A0A0L8VAX3_9BACT|nr:hypothetical protein [Sunxiuqinia dokdonensis]KOH45625.1 hypothetical protein NC99_15500 [Sunxiuqinia dokdonensis]